MTGRRLLQRQPSALYPRFAARRLGAGEGLDGHFPRLPADLDRHVLVDHHADMVVAEEEVAALERRAVAERVAERALVLRVAGRGDAAQLKRELHQAGAV